MEENMKITIAPLASPDFLSLKAWNCIVSADRLFLQTERHPFAEIVKTSQFTYTSMDDLYDAAEDFDELNEAIAGRLIGCGEECVYATTGENEGIVRCLLKNAEKHGIQIDVITGVPIALMMFPEKHVDRNFTACDIPGSIDPHLSCVVTEIDNPFYASDVKLFLSEYYPDEWQIEYKRFDPYGKPVSEKIALSELDQRKDYDSTSCIYVPAATFEELERYGTEDLIEILRILRAPNGCPWDREQTHRSIEKDLIEESYEVIDAIENEDDAGLTEELGDVLMQVVFHASIAMEQRRFTYRDIVTGIVSKLIYRHPHVFGNVKAETAEQVLVNWDKLKKTEKHQVTVSDTMESVAKSFPALMRAKKIQKKAANAGFDWKDAEDAFYIIQEETEELCEAMKDGTNIEEELGDLLFAVVNVARLLKLDPEQALRDATDKFMSRFQKMERAILSDGLRLEDMTQAEMDKYWDLVKTAEK